MSFAEATFESEGDTAKVVDLEEHMGNITGVNQGSAYDGRPTADEGQDLPTASIYGCMGETGAGSAAYCGARR